MNWFAGLVVYALTWWVVLFTILPLGIGRDDDRARDQESPRPDKTGPDKMGLDPGAPLNPRMGWKFFTTTWVSAIVWLLIYALIRSDLISFRAMAAHMA